MTDGTQQLQKLLTSLELLPDPASEDKAPKKAFDATDAEFQVLRSGVTKLAKSITTYIAAAGGVGVLAAGLLNWLVKVPPGVQIALTASVAALLSLALLSVALVVSADLRARAMGAAAQYHARGQVAAAYESRVSQTAVAGDASVTALTSDLSIGLLLIAAGGRSAKARVTDSGDEHFVTGLRYESGHLKVRLSVTSTPTRADPWYPPTEIDEFSSTPE
jgi:hypothetical protein